MLEETNGVVAYATGETDTRAQRSLISDLLLQTEITYSSTVGGELLTDIGWFRSAVPFAPARARSILELTVTGGDVPADASAVVLNVPVTGTQQPGFVTAWPCGSPMPTASNLNFGTQDTVPNAVIVKVGTEGKVCFYSDAATHLVGYGNPGTWVRVGVALRWISGVELGAQLPGRRYGRQRTGSTSTDSCNRDDPTTPVPG